MNNFPFFRFPYNNYYNYYNYRNNMNRNINHLDCKIERNSSVFSSSKDNINVDDYIEQNNEYINRTSKTINSTNNDNKNINTDNNIYKKTNYKNNSDRSTKNKSSKLYFGPIVFDSSSFSNLENPVLELLGLKLYLDDILIISLLYFLYEENVKDETLFISLLLLLIS